MPSVVVQNGFLVVNIKVIHKFCWFRFFSPSLILSFKNPADDIIRILENYEENKKLVINIRETLREQHTYEISVVHPFFGTDKLSMSENFRYSIGNT